MDINKIKEDVIRLKKAFDTATTHYQKSWSSNALNSYETAIKVLKKYMIFTKNQRKEKKEFEEIEKLLDINNKRF